MPSTSLKWCDIPLWLVQKMGNAETWLLPPRSSSKPVLVLDFTDPFNRERTGQRAVVDAAAFLIAEQLWMHTTMTSFWVVAVDDDVRKVITPRWPLEEYEQVSAPLELLDGSVLAWGAATLGFERDGFEMKIRAAGETSERRFVAHLDELATTFADWLVRRRFCERTEPPPWWSWPAGEDLVRYAELVDEVCLQGIANKKGIDPLPRELHESIVKRALAHGARARAGDQHKLLALMTAIAARLSGCLDEELRSEALSLADSLSHPDLRKLMPRLLLALGETERARSALAEARAAVGSGYRASSDHYTRWLDALATELSTA